MPKRHFGLSPRPGDWWASGVPPSRDASPRPSFYRSSRLGDDINVRPGDWFQKNPEPEALFSSRSLSRDDLYDSSTRSQSPMPGRGRSPMARVDSSRSQSPMPGRGRSPTARVETFIGDRAPCRSLSISSQPENTRGCIRQPSADSDRFKRNGRHPSFYRNAETYLFSAGVPSSRSSSRSSRPSRGPSPSLAPYPGRRPALQKAHLAEQIKDLERELEHLRHSTNALREEDRPLRDLQLNGRDGNQKSKSGWGAFMNGENAGRVREERMRPNLGRRNAVNRMLSEEHPPWKDVPEVEVPSQPPSPLPVSRRREYTYGCESEEFDWKRDSKKGEIKRGRVLSPTFQLHEFVQRRNAPKRNEPSEPWMPGCDGRGTMRSVSPQPESTEAQFSSRSLHSEGLHSQFDGEGVPVDVARTQAATGLRAAGTMISLEDKLVPAAIPVKAMAKTSWANDPKYDNEKKCWKLHNMGRKKMWKGLREAPSFKYGPGMLPGSRAVSPRREQRRQVRTLTVQPAPFFNDW